MPIKMEGREDHCVFMTYAIYKIFLQHHRFINARVTILERYKKTAFTIKQNKKEFRYIKSAFDSKFKKCFYNF